MKDTLLLTKGVMVKILMCIWSLTMNSCMPCKEKVWSLYFGFPVVETTPRVPPGQAQRRNTNHSGSWAAQARQFSQLKLMTNLNQPELSMPQNLTRTCESWISVATYCPHWPCRYHGKVETSISNSSRSMSSKWPLLLMVQTMGFSISSVSWLASYVQKFYSSLWPWSIVCTLSAVRAWKYGSLTNINKPPLLAPRRPQILILVQHAGLQYKMWKQMPWSIPI